MFERFNKNHWQHETAKHFNTLNNVFQTMGEVLKTQSQRGRN